MTRTVYLGTANRRAQALYRVVKEAQERAIAAVRAGVFCSAVDRAARQYIARRGYGEYFPHSTGHGLGIQVHEMPGIAAREKTRLPAGAVITIEPGVYVPGYGGVRIEDVVVVRNQGAEVLTSTPKELLQIE
jgi:Xaa-Pro aminopeptidase